MTTSGGSADAEFRRALRGAAPGLARPLPWIGCGDAWAVLVSEVMLQQTSTARVVAPWANFLARFPTPSACADARQSEVVVAWTGLGFPRRARALHQAARVVRDRHGGVVPSSVAELRALPGVGDYTAAAVASFAYGRREAVVDTNVGRVLARAVANAPLRAVPARQLAARLLPARGAAAFNQAMIDLGATFCRATPRCSDCPVASVCRWRREGGEDPAPRSAGVSRRQSAFQGSDRQVRGRVLRELARSPLSVGSLARRLGDVERSRLDALVVSLVDDGLVTCAAGQVALHDG